MTITDAGPSGVHEVLDRLDALLPEIRRRASEVETERSLPDDLLERLTATGCLGTLLPRRYGGLEANLTSAMDVIEMVSGGDGSVGWTTMIGLGAWLDLAGLPGPALEEIFSGGSRVHVAGAFSPSGVAVRGEASYRIDGRWGFVSGCRHADWIYVNCVEEHDGGVRLRLAVLRPDEVHIEDTWRVAGLSGTGSHHVRAEGVVVPEERTWLVMEAPPTVDVPVVRIPTPTVVALAVGAMAVGTARGALDEVLGTADTRVPLLASGPLAADPTFHHHLASADTQLRAARALLHEVAASAWASAEASAPLSLDDRARARAAAAWAVEAAHAAATMAYRAGGGPALYLDSPLQRRMRDLNAVTQHFLVRPGTMATAGAVLAGQQVDVPVL